MADKFCVECGTPRRAMAPFCGSCGTQFDEPGPEPAVEVDEPTVSMEKPPAPPTPAWASPPPPPQAPPGGPLRSPRPPGAPLPPPIPPPPPPSAPSRDVVGKGQGLPVIAGLPADLLAAIVLFALGGGWLGIEVLRALPDVLDLMTADTGGAGVLGDFGEGIRAFGWMTFAALLMAASVAASLLAIAWLLLRLRRIGRGLGWVAAAWLVTTSFIGGHYSGEIGFATLTACLGAAILAFAPPARALLDSAPHPGDRPAAVAVTELTLLACTVLFGLGAIINFAAATFATKYALVGLLEAAVAVGAFFYSRRVAQGEPQLRLAATGCAIVGIVLGLLTFGDPALVAPQVAIAIVAVGTLWLPPDVRELFGDNPIDWQNPLNRPKAAVAAQPPPAPPGPPPAPPRSQAGPSQGPPPPPPGPPPVPPPHPGFPPPPPAPER